MSERHSRREFMGLTAAGVAGILGRSSLGGIPRFSPSRSARQNADGDLIVVNAKVYTMDPAKPRAEAFATSGGRIIAVGSTAEIRGLASKRGEMVDAEHRA